MPLQKPHSFIHSQAARANLGSCTLLRSLIYRTPQTPHFTTRDEFPTWQLIYPHQLALIATRPSPPSMPPVLRKRNVPQAQARKAPPPQRALRRVIGLLKTKARSCLTGTEHNPAHTPGGWSLGKWYARYRGTSECDDAISLGAEESLPRSGRNCGCFEQPYAY
jgi:hypothetical protein